MVCLVLRGFKKDIRQVLSVQHLAVSDIHIISGRYSKKILG